MTERMNPDLMQFCSTDENRPDLHKPFSRDGYTWASDGHILVRVALRPDVNAGGVDVAKFYDNLFVTPELPFPFVAIPDECELCKGSGAKHDCPDCTCECPACGGDNFLRNMSVTVSGVPFAARYIKQLLVLPELKIHHPVKMTGMSFSFAEGAGLLMPLKTPRDHNIDVILTSPAPLVAEELRT